MSDLAHSGGRRQKEKLPKMVLGGFQAQKKVRGIRTAARVRTASRDTPVTRAPGMGTTLVSCLKPTPVMSQLPLVALGEVGWVQEAEAAGRSAASDC